MIATPSSPGRIAVLAERLRSTGGPIVIGLPNGRSVTIATYVAAWRRLREMPGARLVGGFYHEDEPAGQVLGAFRYGLHDRINRHVPGFGRGRKWDGDWQRAAIQTAGRANTPRVILDWVPTEFRARLRHRLREEA